MAVVKEATVAAIGAGAIVAGLVMYAIFRSARIPLIPEALHLADAGTAAPAVMSAAPSLIHAFAMPLLTMACLRMRRRHVAMACLGWLVVDVVFELAQATRITFFPSGTFDPLDLLGVVLGAMLAGAVLRSQSR